MTPLPSFRDPGLEPGFARDGWAVLPALEPPETEALRGLWAEVGGEHSGSYSTTTEKATSLSLRRRVSGAVVRCLESFAKGLVRDCRVVQGGFIVKRPGARGLALHRHPVLMDEVRHVALLAWVALHDVPAESGCMRAASGTHHARPLLGQVFGEPEARDVPLGRGEALVMDHRLVHGSRSNRTGQERLAAGVLLVPDGVPMWYCRPAGQVVEIFEVPDDFYLRWLPGTPPPLEGPPGRRLPLLSGLGPGLGPAL